MTFTTLTFVVFLVAVFALYWSLRQRKAQNILLLLASYVFYGWWDWRFCFLMLASSLLDYFAGLGIERAVRPSTRRAVLIVAMAGNLGMLGYFKYFNFFAANLAASAAAIGWTLDMPTLKIVLPVGISFYTFQTMSYSIDIYRREMRATRDIIDYLAYVSFFPQLVAGPIERGTRLLPQFAHARQFDYARATDGCRQMLWGFLKKMIVADNLAPLVERAFSKPESSSGPELLVGVLFFAVQIYCDFSAYSDIASGTARLFGFELMRNFATPYFSTSMREFWRRWHISLSTWFRDYVYVALGGGRVSRARRSFNVLATFLLSGLWHGASWNFVAWGALHGAAVLPEVLCESTTMAAPQKRSILQPIGRALKMLGVLAVVCLGWIFFRSASMGEALLIVRKAVPALLDLGSFFVLLYSADNGPMGRLVLLAVAVLFVIEWIQREQLHPLQVQGWPAPARWAVYFAGTAALLLYGTYSTSAFIYFQF